MNHRLNAEEASRVIDLVAEARTFPPELRTPFLERACAGADSLRAEAESLLSFAAAAPEFLEQSAMAQSVELLGLIGEGDLKPGDLLGDYRVLSLLGEGGMGEVYLAEDTRLERRVAIKLLKRSLDYGGLLRSFRHERKVLAALTHPNIARLYGGGTTAEGRSYLVMEYVEGERLDGFCRARQLDVPARLVLFRKICAAVSYAHQNLVVHRDLKPANIRVTAEGEPTLLDFGIAKLLEEDAGASLPADQTVTLSAAMTPEYASPEQLKGEAITTSTDVYSLGVVLYELLCGQRPFTAVKGRRSDEIIRAVCEDEPAKPSARLRLSQPEIFSSDVNVHPPKRELPAKLRGLLEGDLDNIVAKALRKEPARRYPSVAALSEDVRRHSVGLPVGARRDTFGYRAGKFVRRHKAEVAAALLVLLALCGGLIATAWQAQVAKQERDRARTAQRESARLNDFLESLLGSVDPEKMGKDVKVAQVLDDAGRKLDQELADEPEILAQAHETLRQAYSHLGLYEPAERHARAAFALVRQLHGADEPVTIRAEDRLAEVLNNRFNYAAAEPLLLNALAVERRRVSPDQAMLAKILSGLGYNAYQQGRPDEAVKYGEEALAHAGKVWSEESRDYLQILNTLGASEFSRHDYAAVEKIFRRVFTLQDRLTPGGLATFPPLLNLSIAQFNQEKFSEMRPAVERLAADTRRLVGEQGLQYALAMLCRGLLEFGEGNYRDAVHFTQIALPVLIANYPAEQLTVVQCRGVLGLSLTRTGRSAEGEPLLREAMADGGALDRTDFAHTFGDLEAALGECLLTQGRYAEAEPLLLAANGDFTKRLGVSNRITVANVQQLHDLYVAWNKPADAAEFTAPPTSPNQ